MLTDDASVIGSEERTDNELAFLHILHRTANLFHDAAILVTDRHWPLDLVDTTVRPEIGTADTGDGKLEDRIRRCEDLRLFHFLETNIAWPMKYCCAHVLSWNKNITETCKQDALIMPAE